MKAIAAIILVGYIGIFKSALGLWITFTAPLLDAVSVSAIALTVLAIVGLTLQLYALLVLVQLTFTPWYRAQPFTN